MKENISGKSNIRELDGLKFLLAITVMLWHARSYLEKIIPLPFGIFLFRGEIATVLFFTLSGLLISFNWPCIEISTLKFVWKRVKKIWPIYCGSVIYIAILYWGKRFLIVNPKLIIRHLLLMQSWPFHNNASSELNGPAWFLSCLFCFWIITPFIKKYITSANTWKYLFLVGLVILYIIEALLNIDCNGIWKIWPFIAYYIGLLVGDIKSERLAILESQKAYKLIVSSFNIMVLLGVSEYACNLKWHDSVMYLIIISFGTVLLTYILIGSEIRSNQLLNSILKSKYVCGGGRLTMNMFLIHSPIMYTMDRIDYISDRSLLWILLAFGGTIIISYIVYKIQCCIKLMT